MACKLVENLNYIFIITASNYEALGEWWSYDLCIGQVVWVKEE